MAGYASGGGSSFTAKHNSLAKTLPATSIDTLLRNPSCIQQATKYLYTSLFGQIQYPSGHSDVIRTLLNVLLLVYGSYGKELPSTCGSSSNSL